MALPNAYDITFEKIGTDGDHIHILCSYHPKYAGSYVVGMFKAATDKYEAKRSIIRVDSTIGYSASSFLGSA
jgi:REP element-mobilizing transposase RayT